MSEDMEINPEEAVGDINSELNLPPVNVEQASEEDKALLRDVFQRIGIEDGALVGYEDVIVAKCRAQVEKDGQNKYQRWEEFLFSRLEAAKGFLDQEFLVSEVLSEIDDRREVDAGLTIDAQKAAEVLQILALKLARQFSDDEVVAITDFYNKKAQRMGSSALVLLATKIEEINEKLSRSETLDPEQDKIGGVSLS